MSYSHPVRYSDRNPHIYNISEWSDCGKKENLQDIRACVAIQPIKSYKLNDPPFDTKRKHLIINETVFLMQLIYHERTGRPSNDRYFHSHQVYLQQIEIYVSEGIPVHVVTVPFQNKSLWQ